MDTLDFELEIGSGSGPDYSITARAPDGGEANATMRLRLTAEELDHQLTVVKSAVIASSAVVRRMATRDEQPVQELGRMLFDALLTGDVRGLFVASYQRARQEGRPLRLVLRIRPPQLVRLPWEFLFDAGRQDYLGLSMPLVRYPQVLEPRRPLRVTPPLQVLGMVARPGDRAALQIEDEQRRLRHAVAGLERDGLLQLDWVSGQTWRDLEEAMDQGPWHVLHFIGHGGFDRDADEGVIALAAEDGHTDPVGASDLSMLLGDHASLRLVVLNACDTGQASAMDAFSSTAGALVLRGIPAVVAMQFEITDPAAVEFARTFYEAVAKQLPVDTGVMRARRRMKRSKKDTLEWGTPVLYLRSLDGRIFDVADASSPGAPQLRQEAELIRESTGPDPLDGLYDEGLAAFWTERWDQAVDIFRQIVARQRDYADAAAKLDQARRQQQLASNYAAARAASDSQAWDQAVASYSAVVAADSTYRDAGERLEYARRQQTLARLQAEARRLHRAQQWAAVLKIGQQLQALDPAAADPDGLVSAASVELAAAERAQTLASHYRAGLRHLNAGAWQQALEAFEHLEQLDPDYRDAPVLLAKARQELSGRHQAEVTRDDPAAPETRQQPPQGDLPPSPSGLQNAANLELVRILRHRRAVHAVAFNPDGRWVATGGPDTTAQVWSLTDGRKVRAVHHKNWKSNSVHSVAFSPDSHWLASGGSDRTARIWVMDSGLEIAKLVHDGAVFSVVFSPTYRRLATGSADQTARIWDVESSKQVAKLAHDGAVHSVAFSPDGRWLATGSADQTARIWDAHGGMEVAKFVHLRAVLSVTFSPDGRWLATGSKDMTAQIWDVTSSKRHLVIRHDKAVRSVAFSPDGRWLATGSSGRTGRIWETDTGQEFLLVDRPSWGSAALYGNALYGQVVHAVAFSPNGHLFATGGDEHALRIWGLKRQQ